MKRELENETNDVAVEESKNNYSGQNSSKSQMLSHNIPNGLVFLLLRNRDGIFFVPSSKNYYDGIEMEIVQINSSFKDLLLPISNRRHLIDIIAKYKPYCHLRISMNVSTSCPTLLIKNKNPSEKFSVNLCTDMIFRLEIKVDHLRFSLSNDDILEIMDESKDSFLIDDINKLNDQMGTDYRRENAIIGELLMLQYARIRCHKMVFYIDPVTYVLPKSFMDLDIQMYNVFEEIRDCLPEDFRNWESDDG